MAIINVRVMTTAGELMLTGEVSPDRIPPEDLKKQRVKPDNLFAITGKDQVECIKKLKTKLEKINRIMNDDQ